MTDLRDDFAMSCPLSLADAYHHWVGHTEIGTIPIKELINKWAEYRYQYADAMLEIRRKK